MSEPNDDITVKIDRSYIVDASGPMRIDEAFFTRRRWWEFWRPLVIVRTRTTTREMTTDAQ